MSEPTLPSDSEMLDFLIENIHWVADIFYVEFVEGKPLKEYPTSRQLIAAEMAKEVE
jgi:hypothetical protein